MVSTRGNTGSFSAINYLIPVTIESIDYDVSLLIKVMIFSDMEASLSDFLIKIALNPESNS